MDQKTRVYCAYGSNMNLEQMSRRCPKAMIAETGMLEGYKLTFRGKFKGVANIEPCKGSEVPVVLWNITEECESSLDMYEGYPHFYTKKTVEVMVNGNLENGMVYIMTSKYADLVAPPTEYYFNLIASGYSDNKIDLKLLESAYLECLSEQIGEK